MSALRILAPIAALLLTPQLGRAGDAPAPPPHRVIPPAADDAYGPLAPEPRPSLVWLATQLLPSPELALSRGTVAGGMRWQVTPLLYSFGLHRKVPRTRFFVVDPLARVSGSVELHLTPEYLGGDVDQLLLRYGVRSTFPLLHRGEYLAVSIGASTFQREDRYRASYDAGIYVLSGILGLEVSVSPAYGPVGGVAVIKLRYF